MLMTLEVLVFVYSFVSAQPNKTQTCLKPRNNATYTCEPNQMIHVISRLYQEASEDCEVPDGACEVTEDSLSNGFRTQCNGNVTCTEDLSLFRIKKTCENITAGMATTSYGCITDPQVNVCSTIVPSLGTHTLYLASPNYPEENSIMSGVCECNVMGKDLIVEILEIDFLFNQNVRANLTLTGDISTWESFPNIFLVYNQKVISETNSLHVMFNAYNRKSQRMWIRVIGKNIAGSTSNACVGDIKGTDMSVEILEIKFLFNLDNRANLTPIGNISSWESYPNIVLMYNQKVISETNSLHVMFNAYNRKSQRMWITVIGTSNLTVECNYVQPVTAVTSATSTETSAADATSATTEISTTLTSTVFAEIISPGSRNTSAIIGALSGVIVILLLLVAALVIYFKCVKPRQMSTSNSTERGDEACYEYVTDNQGYGVQNDIQNTSDNTPVDYADLRHYSNMDNVYTGLSKQGNQALVSESSYSHLQPYANDIRAHGYPDL